MAADQNTRKTNAPLLKHMAFMIILIFIQTALRGQQQGFPSDVVNPN